MRVAGAGEFGGIDRGQLGQAREALARAAAGHARGKIVLSVGQ